MEQVGVSVCVFLAEHKGFFIICVILQETVFKYCWFEIMHF